jgi:hypothetical protein
VVLAHGAGDDRLLPQACQSLIPVAAIADGDTRHLILDGAARRHRVKIQPVPVSPRSVFLIEADDKTAARLAALRALLASGGRTVRCRAPSAFEPTAYQRYRLTLLLRILDHLDRAPPEQGSLRILAQEIVYARELAERSIEWKSSPRRRQTQRLVKAARQMAATGYRRLLNGRPVEGGDAGSRSFAAGDE